MNLDKDYYGILGVPPSATASDIRRAYLRLALLWHPDRHAGAKSEEIAAAEAWFKEIGEAYAVLSDPRQRSDYDFFRARRGRTAAAGSPHPAQSASTASSPGRTAGSNKSGTGRAQTDSSYTRGHNWGSPNGASSRRTASQASSSTRKGWRDRLWNTLYAAFVAAVIFSWWQEPITHIFDSAKEAVGRVSVYAPRDWDVDAPRTFQDMMMENLGFPGLKMKDVDMPDSTWLAIQRLKKK